MLANEHGPVRVCICSLHIKYLYVSECYKYIGASPSTLCSSLSVIDVFFPLYRPLRLPNASFLVAVTKDGFSFFVKLLYFLIDNQHRTHLRQYSFFSANIPPPFYLLLLCISQRSIRDFLIDSYQCIEQFPIYCSSGWSGKVETNQWKKIYKWDSISTVKHTNCWKR